MEKFEMEMLGGTVWCRYCELPVNEKEDCGEYNRYLKEGIHKSCEQKRNPTP